MLPYNEMLADLRTRYHSATFMQLVEQTGVSYGYIRELIVGKRNPEKMSLDIFSRLFPHATINLHGDGAQQTIGDNSNGNIQQIGSGNRADGARDYQLKVFQAIIALELDAKAKDMVLTAINAIK